MAAEELLDVCNLEVYKRLLSGWIPFSNFSYEIEFQMDCLSFIIQMALRRGSRFRTVLGTALLKIRKFFRKTEWLDEILFINARAV